MLRKEREITDTKEIYKILCKSNTIRLGLHDEKYPYVVPISFGLDLCQEKPVIYFHCAKRGMKVDLINKDCNICFESDIFYKVEKTEHGITTRYESIIGFVQCVSVDSEEEIRHGLNLLTAHYGYNDYPLDRCKGLANVKIFKINIDKISGKRNLTI